MRSKPITCVGEHLAFLQCTYIRTYARTPVYTTTATVPATTPARLRTPNMRFGSRLRLSRPHGLGKPTVARETLGLQTVKLARSEIHRISEAD
jgi:hypothetical protein